VKIGDFGTSIKTNNKNNKYKLKGFTTNYVIDEIKNKHKEYKEYYNE
jgi:hypothetical protein